MNLLVQRLYNQRLEGQKFTTPGEVVAWFGAVQAQEYALARWALGQRMVHGTDVQVEQAFADGAILRTHVMRPTWHFVTPDDIRWLLELTAPRVHIVNGYMYRQLELDKAVLKRADNLIGEMVAGGNYRTRAEIAAGLAEHDIDTSNGIRLGYLVHHAELERIVCSGPPRGKQHTYALLDERAPNARRLTRDEALAELTRRFFTSHGPATVKDFAWWSGLTVADVKAGLAMLGGDITSEVINGDSYYFTPSSPPPDPPARGYLLPVYDEYTIAYKNHSSPLNPAYEKLAADPLFTSAFVYKGELIAMWRRTISKKTLIVEHMPFRPFSPEETAAFAAAAHQFGAFLNLPVLLP
jgi:hypothetical protein